MIFDIGDQVFARDDITKTPGKVMTVYTDGSFDLEPCIHITKDGAARFDLLGRSVCMTQERIDTIAFLIEGGSRLISDPSPEDILADVLAEARGEKR